MTMDGTWARGLFISSQHKKVGERPFEGDNNMNGLKPVTQRMIAIAACFGIGFMILLLLFSRMAFFGALLFGAIVAVVILFVMMLGWLDKLAQPSDHISATITTPVKTTPVPTAGPNAVPVLVDDSEYAANTTPTDVPAQIDPVAATQTDTGKPDALAAPRAGGADNLKLIKGVGPKLEMMLNGMGIYHFDQVAAWGAGEQKWVDDNLQGFKGRASRDKWVEQAKALAAK